MRVLVGVKLNDALGLINDVALAGFLRHHIRAGGQLGQVDLAVSVGGKFFGAVVALDGSDLKNRVGNDTAGIGAVHFHQLQSRLHIVEEKQLLDAVPRGQLHFLRRDVEDVTVAAGVHLHGAIGAGFHIGQQDLAKLIRLEFAEGNGVAPDLKDNAGHGNRVLAVILDDPQTGQFLVHQRKGGRFAGSDRRRIGGVILLPAGGRGDLLDLIRTRFDAVKNGIARKIGFRRIGHAAFDVLDLHHGPGQVRAGIG